MREHIVLIGAGSAMFTRGLVADLIHRQVCGELALVDIDPDALAVAEGVTRKMLAARGADLTVRATPDRRDVLPGATAVISTIGVGGRRAWEQDVFIPRRYGIYQPTGDCVMPGGTSRALRMIPAMVAIAEDVQALAPEALFFNYANPMSPNCRAVHRATGAPMVGLCHGVFQVARYLADVLRIPEAAMTYTAVGINHLTWFLQVRAGGEDVMPRLREIARQVIAQPIERAHLANMFAEDGTAARGEVPRGDDNPFSWRLLDLFGGFPAVLDRHVTEFFPAMFQGEGAYYGKTLGVDAYTFEGVIAYGDRIFAEMREIAESPAPLPADFFARISGEHEQVVEIIEAIRRDSGTIYSANLPNTGQIPNLPPGAVVEGPARATRAGLALLPQPPLPPGIAGTLATRFQWAETLVEAALEGSREKFIQALVLDGAVRSPDAAAQLADDLLEAHAAYLPQFARDTAEQGRR